MKLVCAATLASVLFASHAAAQTPVCAPSDGNDIKTWMAACDSVAGSSKNKCGNSGCHTALHRLEEEETHECWEYLGFGSHHDFDKYVALDAFCHGEGPDPNVTPAPTTAPPTTKPPTTPPMTSNPSATSSPPSNTTTAPSPTVSAPSVTPKPQC